jgi:hypothetical protein
VARLERCLDLNWLTQVSLKSVLGLACANLRALPPDQSAEKIDRQEKLNIVNSFNGLEFDKELPWVHVSSMWDRLLATYNRLPPRFFGTLAMYRYRGQDTRWFGASMEPGVRLIRIGETNLIWTRPAAYRARLVEGAD